MNPTIRRLLLLVFVLFAVGCEPPQPPQMPHRQRLDARALLISGECLARQRSLQAGDIDDGALASNGGAPPQNDPATMAVREPILKELLAYAKAPTSAEKARHAQKLRELFEGIAPKVAAPFTVKLETDDVLAVKFREILKSDQLKDELLGILERKVAPKAAAPPSPPAEEESNASEPGVDLPEVDLTVADDFQEMHQLVTEGLIDLKMGVGQLRTWDTAFCKDRYTTSSLPALSHFLNDADIQAAAALALPEGAQRNRSLQATGDMYLGALYAVQLLKPEVNAMLAADYAAAAGVARKDQDRPPVGYATDKDIVNMMQASLDSDRGNMLRLLPAAQVRFQFHVEGLDKWVKAVQAGEILSKKVIKVLDIAMIAVSIYQVAKIPVVAGTVSPPPTIIGVLPGGAALGSRFSLATISSAVEAIQNLVAVGAMDGALVGGLGTLTGSPSAVMPELQKPSLSVRLKPPIQPAKLEPYRGPGGGHHVPAKKAFEGAPNYDPNKALAIPNEEMQRLRLEHFREITPEQMRAYREFAKTGQPLTWEAVAKIEKDVLVKAGMKPGMARATVAKALQALKDAGVPGPVRIPWGGSGK